MLSGTNGQKRKAAAIIKFNAPVVAYMQSGNANLSLSNYAPRPTAQSEGYPPIGIKTMNPEMNNHEKIFVRAISGSDKAYQQSEFVVGYVYNSTSDPIQQEDIEALQRYIDLVPISEPEFKRCLEALKIVFEFMIDIDSPFK